MYFLAKQSPGSSEHAEANQASSSKTADAANENRKIVSYDSYKELTEKFSNGSVRKSDDL